MSKRKIQSTLFGFKASQKPYIEKPNSIYDQFINQLWQEEGGGDRKTFQARANSLWSETYKNDKDKLFQFLVKVGYIFNSLGQFSPSFTQTAVRYHN